MTHSYVRHDSFICATWLIDMCITHGVVITNSDAHISHIYEYVTSHICASHIWSSDRKSRCACLSHIWMRHVTRMNQSRPAYEWVTSRVCANVNACWSRENEHSKSILVEARVSRQNEYAFQKVRNFWCSQQHTHLNTLQHTALHCNTLQRTATHRNAALRCEYECCDAALQHSAARCNTLQHTATHCNTAHLKLRLDTCICGAWLVHVWNVTHSHVQPGARRAPYVCHIWISHVRVLCVTYEWVMSRIWMIYVPHMNYSFNE